MKNIFKDLRIAVLGEAGLDVYLEGESTRQSQEADVPIINNLRTTKELPGMAANVAMNLRALGAQADLFTVLGRDLTAEKLSRTLSIFPVFCDSRPTIMKQRLIINGTQHVARIDVENNTELSDKTQTEFADLVNRSLKNYDAVILQDYGKGLWTDYTLGLIDMCQENGIKVFVDPHQGKTFADYAGAFLIKPNRSEYLKMSNKAGYMEEATYLVITKGDQGMECLTKQDIVFASTNPVATVDITGAGDTVLAVMTCMLMTGHTIEEAMHTANKAAKKVVQKLGVATVSYKDL